MNVGAIGFVTLALGVLAVARGAPFALRLLVLSILLGAASAVTIGDPDKGSSVQPAYVLLGFCVLVLIVRDRSRRLMFQALAFGQPGFWFLVAVTYGAAGAAILPRLFEGQTYVYAIVRTDGGLGLTLRPLTPVSGNLTQSIYLAGGLVAFAIGSASAAMPDRLRVLVGAFLACAAANLALGAVDLIAFRLGLGDVLGFLRNANYRMLQDGEIVGFKRIVGSFPEASSYAYMTLGLFVFCLRLWIAGVRQRLSGTLALLSGLAIALTTSSSGYVGLAAGLGLSYAHCLGRAARGQNSPAVAKILILVPTAVVLAGILIALNEDAQRMLVQLGEATVVNKLSTQSGVERALWNRQAIEVFFDTSGLGAGVGSVRASSFLVALLSNVGVVGTALYAAFLLAVLRGDRRPVDDPYRGAVEAAAQASCGALLASAAISSGGVDLGLPFYLLAGIGSSRLHAAAAPAPHRRPAPSALGRPALASPT